MDCFHDFCLACDRESINGPYCSQACRLADLERASTSAPSSTSSPTTRTSHSASDCVPAPTYDLTSKPAAHGTLPLRSSFFMWTPTRQAQDSSDSLNRILTPSSSRTSLSSTSSGTTSHGGLTEQAKRELQDYFNSFDQTRAAKRRTSLR